MRDDDADDGEKHEATTVPPPAGESDPYEAATRVGGLPPEALAMLRQLREEKPPRIAPGDANVPVFTDDDEDEGQKPGLVGPAAGSKPKMKAAAPVAAAPVVASAVSSPRGAPAAPLAPPPPVAPQGPAPLPLSILDIPPAAESAPAFSVAKPPRARHSDPPLIAAAPAEIAEPLSYESVFAPLPPSTATPDVGAPPAAPASAPVAPATGVPVVVVLAGLVLVVLAVVLLGQAGLIPGLRPVAPATAPAPAPRAPSH